MSLGSKFTPWVSGSVLLASVLFLLVSRLALAQEPSAADTCRQISEIEPPIDQAEPPQEDALVTPQEISQKGLTDPSFWWAQEQFNQFDGKLINSWVANKEQKRLYLFVNRQLWTLMDYLGRYSFVNKFGTVARDYQYDVGLFNQEGLPLASYTCDYSQTPTDCTIRICQSSWSR
ncbi:hypothetical protein [Lyngbya aestuarii]|uniref:hypothetical protein n=1 Tax=Lyngbya aestuarii TaxID=118322 RepID=UPI00403DD4D7